VADLASIETRVAGWVASCAPLLKVFEEGSRTHAAVIDELFQDEKSINVIALEDDNIVGYVMSCELEYIDDDISVEKWVLDLLHTTRTCQSIHSISINKTRKSAFLRRAVTCKYYVLYTYLVQR
jgi:hypothetical protein